MTIWILAADSSRARVFQTEKLKDDFVEMKALTNPSGRLKEIDLVTDTPGSLKDSSGLGRHSYTPKSQVKDVAEKNFAKEVASSLDKALQDHDFQHLYVIAAPKFLGELRANFSDDVKNRVRGEYHYDISTLKPEKIHDFLQEHL